MDLADIIVVEASRVAIEAGAAVAGASVVLGRYYQTWGWPKGQKNRGRGDTFDQALAQSKGRHRRHGTLRSPRLEYRDPRGRDYGKCNCDTMRNGDGRQAMRIPNETHPPIYAVHSVHDWTSIRLHE